MLCIRYIEIPEHTETPEHTGNYRSTLHFFFIFYVFFFFFFFGLNSFFFGKYVALLYILCLILSFVNLSSNERQIFVIIIWQFDPVNCSHGEVIK